MSRLAKLLFTLGVLIFVLSCSQEEKQSQVDILMDRYQSLINQNDVDQTEIRKVAGDLAEAFETSAPQQGDSSLQAEYYYKAAELYEGFPTNIMKALELYNKIISVYPKSEMAADALFHKGFLYNETLKDTAKAREAYEAFINNYPDHELVDDAQREIDHLGMTPEEIYQEIMKKQDSIQQGEM